MRSGTRYVNGWSPRRIALCLLAAVLAVATPAVAASADPVLDTAEADVQVNADGTAAIELTYHVIAGPEGESVDSLAFSSLDFGGGLLSDLRVTNTDGSELRFESESVKAKTSTTVALNEPLQPGDTSTVHVSYIVSAAGAVDGETMTTNVPMLTLDHPAATAAPETFTATVHLPEGHSLIEGFPSNTEDITAIDGAQVLHYQVPAVPSLVRAVSTEGERTWWTTEAQMQAVLLLTIVVGIGLLYVSFVRPQRKAAQARAGHTIATVSKN